MQLGNLYVLWTTDQRLTGQGLLACAARRLLGPTAIASPIKALNSQGGLSNLVTLAACALSAITKLASYLIASWIGKDSKVNSSGYGGLHLLIR
jgi:hypothetical protein